MSDFQASRRELEPLLSQMAPVAVAVSGGVDSLTLASVSARTLGAKRMLAVHAISPAVPAEATARVRAQAVAEGWALRIVEAGEFADPSYRANPANRCFFCKTNLYATIARVTDRQIVSGANCDDLGEYRPGLEAARQHGVRHPYVEAGLDKADVRALARGLGLAKIAALPAQPCLSSRIETGIRIEAETLAFVHAVERHMGINLPTAPGRAIRCRVRASGLVVELDPTSLAAMDAALREKLTDEIGSLAPDALADRPITFAPYRNGSAFLTDLGAVPA